MAKGVFADLAGQKFGRLTVQGRDFGRAARRPYWLCKCDCGMIRSVRGNSLTGGLACSCGCLHREKVRSVCVVRNTTHGQASRGASSKEYRAWANMKLRCFDPTNKQYRDYGGRGITVCEEWRADFQAFYDHIGPAPSSRHTIDRIDNNKGYEPGNVRWATRSVQVRNQRKRGPRRVVHPTKVRVAQLRAEYPEWSLGQLAAAVGVTYGRVWQILRAE